MLVLLLLNAQVARKIITKKYSHILNLHCIAHFINLITKSILGMFILHIN